MINLHISIKLNLLALSLIPFITTNAFGDNTQKTPEWEINTGVIALYAPASPGIDDYKARAFPFADVTYQNRYFLNFQKGLGAYVFGDKRSDTSLALSIGYAFGRDESDSSYLVGLGDVDGSVEARLFFNHLIGPVNFQLSVGHALNSDGHEGSYGTFNVSMNHRTEKGLLLSAGPFIQFADDSYLESYYGVNSAQSINSGYNTYRPSAGIDSYGVSAFAMMPITENWFINSQITWRQYSSEVKDSPFITESGQFSSFISVFYKF